MGGEDDKFGALLRDLRLAVGWTQATLAERARLSVRGIQHLESGGTQPYRHTVQQLAEALGLSSDVRRRFEAAALPAPRRRPPTRAGPDRCEPLPGRLLTGTVTLAFAEVGLLRLSNGRAVLARPAARRCLGLVRTSLEAHGGWLGCLGQSERVCVAAFARVAQAVLAAVELRESLRRDPEPLLPAVRVVLHTGEVYLQEGEYRGGAVESGARLLALADWGQTLLSEATAVLARDAVQAAGGSAPPYHDLDDVVSKTSNVQRGADAPGLPLPRLLAALRPASEHRGGPDNEATPLVDSAAYEDVVLA